MAEQYPIAALRDDEQLLQHCVEILSGGGLAVFPTDTVYGVGVRADRNEGVERLYAIKERPRGLPIPVLLGSPEDLDVYGSANPLAHALARRYWPGAVTIVVPSRGVLASNLSMTSAIGFRCPNHPTLRKLIRAVRVPLAATSANRSGEREAHRLSEVPAEMRELCDLVLEGGILHGASASTVVDCRRSIPKLIRRGEVEIEVA